MLARQLEKRLLDASKNYPVITVTGPRQSGKTTLVKEAFPDHVYVSLEDPDNRSFALEDPRGFLNQFPKGVILDEVQRAPELLSYIQSEVDRATTRGRFVLSGSQNILLLEAVSQSLAGRAAIFHLLPFSRSELLDREPLSLNEIGQRTPKTPTSREKLLDVLHTGFYPRIHDQKLDPQDWLQNYYQTYIERDVRSVANVGDLEAFGRFVRLCAGRCGQLLNLSSLGADCGISHATARRWLSVLETSFIVFLLRPHHKNFNKRLVKSPKLYFLDTGLLCYLLRIRKSSELAAHASRGAVFESFVIGELLKACYNSGSEPNLYFWRDSTGHEIDVLIDRGIELAPIEVKSGETIPSDALKGLDYWKTLPKQQDAFTSLVYGGDQSFKRSGTTIYSWRAWL